MGKITFKEIEELISKAQSPLGIDWLEKAYGEHHNYHKFLYLLSMYMKPKVAVEIGVFHGLGSQHLGEAAKRHGGVCIGIDNGTLLDYNTSNGVINMKDKPLTPPPHYFTVKPLNFEFIVCNSSTAPEVLAKVASYGKIDLLYHDTKPSYLLAKEEWEAYRPLMSDDGIWISDHLYETRAIDTDPWDKSMMHFFNEIVDKGEKRLFKDVLQKGITQGMIIL